MWSKVKALLHMLIIFAVFFLADSFSIAMLQILNAGTFYTEIFYICINILSVFIIIYLYSKYILKKSFVEIYLGKPLPSLQWCITAFIMPVAIDIFYFFFTKGKFQWGNYSKSEIAYILLVVIFSSGLKTSVVEEILLRGLALSYLQETFGKKTGILFANFIYISINLVYIDIYDWNKIFLLVLAVFVQGTAYSLITCITRSVWSAVTVHALYNILSGNSDILHISSMQTYFAICTYKLESRNWLVTGVPDWNSIDTAVPAITGHLILIVLAVLYARKNNIKSIVYIDEKEEKYGTLCDTDN